MTAIFYILAIVLFLGHIAGQIYLISKAIHRFGTPKTVLKIITGIFAFAVLNIPSFIASLSVDPSHLSSLPMVVNFIFGIWILAISIFGIVWFCNDYWQYYKKKRTKSMA